MNIIQRIKQDLDNNAIVSRSTWLELIDYVTKENRVVPVKLAPHIKDALKRWTDMQLSAWTDVIQAQDRIDYSEHDSNNITDGYAPGAGKPTAAYAGDLSDEQIMRCDIAFARAILKDGIAGLSAAGFDVLAERQRQKDVEGWTEDQDDDYKANELPKAAACYAYPELVAVNGRESWPWSAHWWKPSDPRRNYVKAAALLLAEIERIDRATTNGASDL